MKAWFAAGVLGIVLAAVAAALFANRALDRPLALPMLTPEQTEYIFDVAPGSSLQAVANRLAEQGLLRMPRLLAWYGELTGRAQNIQAGEYALTPGMTPRTLLELLVSGKVRLHALTVIEGWTARELLTAINRHPALVTTLQATTAPDLATELGLQYASAEGMFLPETYRFARGTTDAEFLQRSHAALLQALDSIWASRGPNCPVETAYEALTLASIIERETGLAAERREVAGVFARRLQQGWRLETDPTVIYGLGQSFDGNLRRRDLDTDTPYNTYTRAGLPPTPIALPGRDSIAAAVNPAEGDAMFFVASGKADGSHVFSVTLAEHNRAVQRYLAALRTNTTQ